MKKNLDKSFLRRKSNRTISFSLILITVGALGNFASDDLVIAVLAPVAGAALFEVIR